MTTRNDDGDSRRRSAVCLGLIAVVAAAAIATTLIAMALQRNVAYLYTPSEALRGDAGQHARFRLGGMVASGSFKRAPGSMEAHFAVDDGDATLPVVFTGILPDLFKEGKGAVAQGQLGADGTFLASEVLAKHDENYMPPEAAEALAKAKAAAGAQTSSTLVVNPR